VLELGSCAGISGDVAALAGHGSLTTLQLAGTNVTGDLGEALEDCTTLTGLGFNDTKVSGDITKIYRGTGMQTAVANGCVNLSGDLSGLPAAFYFLSSTGRSGSKFSWSADDARPASSTIIAFDNVDLGDDVENMLINQASCTPRATTTSWLHRRIAVLGDNISADSMSAACSEACAALAQKGYQIYINNVLVVDPAA